MPRQPGQRPPDASPPARLSPNPPVPQPDAIPALRDPDEPAYGNRDGLDPVRYGDWESKGIAIDF